MFTSGQQWRRTTSKTSHYIPQKHGFNRQMGLIMGLICCDPCTTDIAFGVISVPEIMVGDEGLEPPTSCV